MPKKELITVNNVNIQPLMESLIELVKDKKLTGELDDLISAVDFPKLMLKFLKRHLQIGS